MLTAGFPLGNGFTRMFTNYSYERVRVTEISQLYNDPIGAAAQPVPARRLLSGAGGERIISKVVPSLVHNTVDQPIFPTTGRRLTASIDLAGLGGNTNFYKPMLEGVYFWRQNARIDARVCAASWNTSSSSAAAVSCRSSRSCSSAANTASADSTCAPSARWTRRGWCWAATRACSFNVEQAITIAGPVRLILFYDAGQVRDNGQQFAFIEEVQEHVFTPPLLSPLNSRRDR